MKMKRYFQNFYSDFIAEENTKFDNKELSFIANDILFSIPNIYFISAKMCTGICNKNLIIFRKIERLIVNFQNLVFFSTINYEKLVLLETFQKIKEIFEKLIQWLSVNDQEIIVIIINSIPKIVNIFFKINHLISINKNKKIKIENSCFLSFKKTFIRRVIQIFSCLSTSADVKIRLSCIYNTNQLIKIQEFDFNLIEDAFSSPTSLLNHLKSIQDKGEAMYGDTTNTDSFNQSIFKFDEISNKHSFVFSFSALNIRRIKNINGERNEIYDLGWLYRRLDDESPAVRFEIFEMIYQLLICERIFQYESLLKIIYGILFDCFLDDNIAIQSLIAEIIILISKKIPIKTSDLLKILPCINDSNINTRYNILKIISNSIFDNYEALYKALTTLLDSPLIHVDEKLLYNIFSLVGINHSNFAHIIVPILFKQYYHKEEEFYHASISILFFWALWKEPSIITKFNLDIILLYSIVKLNFSSYIPNLRIRLSNEKMDCEGYEIKPQLYNLNIMNYAFGIYPKNSNIKMNKTCNTIKSNLFVFIGNCFSFKKVENQTLMNILLNEFSPLEYVLNYSISYFTSFEYIKTYKETIFNLLKIFIFFSRLNSKNLPRINTSFNIKLLFKMFGFNMVKNLFFFEKLDFNQFYNELNKHKNLTINHKLSIWPKYSKLNMELSNILGSEKLLFSSFIISTPILCGSISFSYFYENYKPSNNKLFAEKQCLLSGNLTKYFSEFQNLCCMCILCKYRIYNHDINLQYLDGYSNVIYLKTKDALEKKNKPIKYIFPYKIPQKIPVNISFNVTVAENSFDNLCNSNILIFVQIPHVLHFTSLKTKKMPKQYQNSFRKRYEVDLLKEMNFMNFGFQSSSNIYSKLTRERPLKIEINKENSSVENMFTKLAINSRETYIFTVGKNTLRISSTYLIPVKYESPTATPITINTVLVNQMPDKIEPISNTYLTVIHPNIMA